MNVRERRAAAIRRRARALADDFSRGAELLLDDLDDLDTEDAEGAVEGLRERAAELDAKPAPAAKPAAAARTTRRRTTK